MSIWFLIILKKLSELQPTLCYTGYIMKYTCFQDFGFQNLYEVACGTIWQCWEKRNGTEAQQWRILWNWSL